ncbi:MAG: transposase [Gammaproteobacteria bacterium]
MYLPDIPVHVVQRGNNRDACFLCEDVYRYFLDRLREGQSRFGVALHAYVLLTNHVHLLMTPRDTAGISRLMQHLGGAIMFCTSTASTGVPVRYGKDATRRVSCKRTNISSPLCAT